MSRRIATDLVASVLGRGLGGALQFCFTPVYISFLGIDSYGLIGFYTTTLAALLFLDQAISPAIVRSLAASSDNSTSARQVGNTLRTMELITLATALALGGGLFATSSSVVGLFMNESRLPAPRLIICVQLMALLIVAQWPSFLYSGALAGLRRQVLLNATRGGIAIIQWTGGALVAVTTRRIEYLMLWQALCLGAQTLLLKFFVWRHMLPTDERSRFSLSSLRGIWRFSTGTFVIGITGSILTQADKLAVSRFSSLATFAAYSLAFTLVSLLSVFVVQPVMTIAFPHFTRLFVSGDQQEIEREYRKWTQVIVTIIMPMTGVLVFFPDTVLDLWVRHGSAEISSVARALPWIALGTMFNVVMMLPFNLQLASGWTSLSSIKNLVITPIYLPVMVWGVARFGFMAGALAWLAVNATYYLVEVYVMHRRLLRHVMVDWWLRDTFLPIAGSLGAFAIVRLLLGSSASDLTAALAGVATAFVVFLAMLVTMPYPRALASALVRRRQ